MKMDVPPPAKRPRLSTACNECRRRKVKCDAEYPKCRNCRSRNDTCVTTDPRRPKVTVIREWVELPDSQPSASENGPAAFPHQADNASQQQSPSAARMTAARPPSSNSFAANDHRYDYANASGNVYANPELQGISPVQQPFDMSFNADQGTDRIKMLGGSSSQCLIKSLDVYLKAAHVQPMSAGFSHGMRYVEEIELPLRTSLPLLPDVQHCESYLSVYFAKIHVLYPLFDIDAFKESVRNLATLTDLSTLSHEQVPSLVSAYLALSLGADEEAQKFTDDGNKYLEAAAGLLAHVLLIPYLPAVQALLLFTIACRGRNKDGVGWQTLGIAVRIAHTLGLHRHSAIHPSSQHVIQQRYKQLFHARIWAICCSLEKTMQLESGRPTIIDSVDLDQMMNTGQGYRGNDFLQWHMGLAQYQGLINQHIYGHRPGNRTASQILRDTADLDHSVLSWASAIPISFRPGSDLFCPDHEFHVAAFISIQYYQTMIALHRAALISPATTFQSEVDKYCADDESRLRLRGGESICVNSARSIARLCIELSDRNVESRIFTAGPPLLACVVLGISLMKNPGSRMQPTDLELLKACVEFTTNHFLKSGHNEKFAQGISSIYNPIRSYIERKSRELQTATAPTTKTSSVPFNTMESYDEHQRQELPQKRKRRASRQDNNATSNGSTSNYALESGQTVIGLQGYDSEWGPDHQLAMLNSNEKIQDMDPMAPSTGLMSPEQDIYAGALPFDNLSVEELWNWMMVVDSDSMQADQSLYGNFGGIPS